MKINQENRESHKMDEELCERVREELELKAIKPHTSETLKDLLREDGRPEEERELTPEMREMVREYIYNFSKMYLQVLREEKSRVTPRPKTIPQYPLSGDARAQPRTRTKRSLI